MVLGLDLENGVIRVYGQRDREGKETKATKGKRFRSVQIGPTLAESLREERSARNAVDDDWLFLCPPPKRGRYSRRTEPVPPSRKTVHDWHEAALQDAGLRDMPLHALRHTAAAAWLARQPELSTLDLSLEAAAVTGSRVERVPLV